MMLSHRIGGLAAALTLLLTACAGSMQGVVATEAETQPVTAAPTVASENPSASAPASSAESNSAASADVATGWTISTLPGAPFTMAGQRCGFADIRALPAKDAIAAIEGIWELEGKSTMSGFPMTARITITAGGGKAQLGAVPMDDSEVVDEGPVAAGTADWVQNQQGSVNGVSLQSTGGGVGKWRYFASGDVVFELQATKKVVVTVDGMEQSFPMQWPQWNLSEMRWRAEGCAP